MSSPFLPAWLARDPRATALLPAPIDDAAARRAAVAAAGARAIHPAVLAALGAAEAALPPSPARRAHLEALARKGTAAVVTGQQVGLFGGPLFTFAKAATAIAAARALAAETGTPVVPVFWMQTEDHDVAEVDHTFVARADGPPLRIALGAAPGAAPGNAPERAPAAARIPVAHRVLGDGVLAALDALEVALGHHPAAPAHLTLLREAYVPERTFGEAFAWLLAAVFADEGLVVFAPRGRAAGTDEPIARALAVAAAPVHRLAVTERATIEAALSARSAELEAAGFAVQVPVRQGCALSFYAPDGAQGARFRLEQSAEDAAADDGPAFVAAGHGAQRTRAALCAELETDPARFSTSALLRPLLQDTWLPTAASVLGPGELAYVAQLPPLYAKAGLPQPLALPRLRVRVLDDRICGLLGRLDVVADDVPPDPDALLALVQRRRQEAGAGEPDPGQLVADAQAALAPTLQALTALVAELDPSLPRAVAKASATIDEALGRVAAKAQRALAQRDQARVDQATRLCHLLWPQSAPQERTLALASFACRFGADTIKRQLLSLAAQAPFAGARRDLVLGADIAPDTTAAPASAAPGPSAAEAP